MAFNDIKAWREIMDADEQDRLAYDRACAAAERRAAQAERDEYDEIEQASVDPETCACDCGNDGCVCLDDLEDDEVDFSAYGIDEADLGVGPADEHYPTARDLAREPLVRIPAAMGRPASDADLAAQDIVQLMMEALKKLQEKKAAEQLDEEQDIEETADELEEDDAQENVDAKIEQLSQDDDYPLSDADWDEIMELPTPKAKIDAIKAKVEKRWSSLSAEAKRKIRDDVEDLRKDMLRSKWSEMRYKEALRLQKITKTRDLTPEELEKFRKIVQFDLDDEQRGALEKNVKADGYRIGRHRTARVPASDAQSGNVKDAFAGEGADERRAETGLDSEFDINKFQYVPEPMEPGTEIPADFDPTFPGSAEIRKRQQDDVDAVAARLKPGHEQRKKAWMRRAAADLPDGDEGLLDRANDMAVWKKIVGALDPEEVEEIKQELMRELPGEDHEKKILLKCVFDTFGVTRKDLMSAIGVGGDQKGQTGMWTQNTDKLINLILIALAVYLNICQDPIDLVYKEIVRHYGSEVAAFQANLRSEDTIYREARKTLRPIFFDEICAELGTDPNSVAEAFGAVPSYSAGRREKAAADRFVMMLFVREWDRNMTQSDKEDVRNVFDWYENGTEIRKLKTNLTPELNAEFQQLIAKMRDEGDLPDEDRVRLVQLDILRRRGGSEDAARERAEREYREMEQEGSGEFVKYSTKLAKEFLRGKSPNITKDTITNPDRAN